MLLGKQHGTNILKAEFILVSDTIQWFKASICGRVSVMPVYTEAELICGNRGRKEELKKQELDF